LKMFVIVTPARRRVRQFSKHCRTFTNRLLLNC